MYRLVMVMLLAALVISCVGATGPKALVTLAPTASSPVAPTLAFPPSSEPATLATLAPTASSPVAPTLAPPRFSEPATSTSAPTAIPIPTGTFVPAASRTSIPTPTQTPIPTASVSRTADPYAGLSIDELSKREYGRGGSLEIKQTLGISDAFTRTLITYPSDGLTVFGFMDVPRGRGPFPVVLVLHGYVNPVGYDTLTYTTGYADALGRAGFLVVHPNLRGYPPSDNGPNLFRVGFAVDVLNLMALIRAQGGKPGPLEKARPDVIGLWGHSMGGGIAQRVMTVSPEVRAVVLYGAMSGDEAANYAKIVEWSGGGRGLPELVVPPEVVRRISPASFQNRVSAPVSIHHGESDGTVPLQWSQKLCSQLQALNKTVECFYYPGQPHTFVSDANNLFIRRSIEFLNKYLRAP